MASQSNEIMVLTFTPDNPCNTMITAPGGEVLYTVSTTHEKHTLTSVYDKFGLVIGTLQWRDTLSDKVTFRDGPSQSYSDWLKKSHVPFKDELSFKDNQDRKYKWRGLSESRSIEMYGPDDNFRAPIARYTRSYRKPDPDSEDGGSGRTGFVRTPGELALLPRALEIQDLVVVSLLFEEKQYRDKYRGGMGDGAMVGVMTGMGLGTAAAAGGW